MSFAPVLVKLPESSYFFVPSTSASKAGLQVSCDAPTLGASDFSPRSYACGFCFLAIAPSIYCDEKIWQVLWWFSCVFSKRIPVSSYDIAHSSLLFKVVNDSLYGEPSHHHSVFAEVSFVYRGLGPVSHLRSDPLRRWLLVVFVNDVWGLVLLLLLRDNFYFIIRFCSFLSSPRRLIRVADSCHIRSPLPLDVSINHQFHTVCALRFGSPAFDVRFWHLLP